MLITEQLEVRYGAKENGIIALNGVNIEVREGEFFTLLGPSGCGKSTLLRSIAGLEKPTSGRIRINGSTVFDGKADSIVPANMRDISMVFQSYAIWPHMTVGQNVSFPLEMAKMGSAERSERTREALEMVGLGPLSYRPASLLSGGQQQRVALARAIVKNARILLLDEPLSNLDAKLRDSMRAELRSLQRKLGTTTIYVTHDQDEALTMSDRIALMRHGEVVEIGTPEELYYRPQHRFTAQFLGDTLLLPATLLGACERGISVETPIGNVVARAGTESNRRFSQVAIRPEHFSIVEQECVGINVWPAIIESVGFAGRWIEYTVVVGQQVLVIPKLSSTKLERGTRVFISVPVERCILVEE